MAETRKRKRRSRQPKWLPAAVLALVFVIGGVGIWRHQQKNSKLPGEDIEVPPWVQQEYLTVNEWSRPGTPLEKIDGVVIHYVGNPNTSAEANRNYFDSLSTGVEGIYASSHFIVGLDGEVVQCIPLTEIAYASNTRNEDTIAVEVCHPDETGAFSPMTMERVTELTAWLCTEFDLKPEEVIRHYDVSGKICPKFYVENEDAWREFLDRVEERIDQGFEKD